MIIAFGILCFLTGVGVLGSFGLYAGSDKDPRPFLVWAVTTLLFANAAIWSYLAI